MTTPAWVRYGWSGFPDPEITLFNAEGLPASPFEVPVVEAVPAASQLIIACLITLLGALVYRKLPTPR